MIIVTPFATKIVFFSIAHNKNVRKIVTLNSQNIICSRRCHGEVMQMTTKTHDGVRMMSRLSLGDV